MTINSTFMAFTKIICLGTAVGVSLKCVYAIFKWWDCKDVQQCDGKLFKTIFFPDKKVACRNQFTKRHGCTSPVCKFSHDDTLSYSQLMRTLARAKFSVDLCVFCITADELRSILCEMNQQGISVRIITDSEQVSASGSQIGAFRKEGIHVRCDDTTFYMHHKFAIIDKQILINGSFNWTRAAITGNFENLCITNYPNIVQPFITEFEKLWQRFDRRVTPKNNIISTQ